MQILIDEVRIALAIPLYMPAVITLFAIPDAAATVEYGYEPPRLRYPRWFDRYVNNLDAGIDGKLAWLIRNALIHETAVNWRAAGLGGQRLLIKVPGADAPYMHGFSIETPDREKSGIVELTSLADAILVGAERWLDDALGEPDKKAKIEGMMQYRPKGFQPYLNGAPLIT